MAKKMAKNNASGDLKQAIKQKFVPLDTTPDERYLFGVLVEFELHSQDSTLYQMEGHKLQDISESPEFFPRVIRQRATYWLNSKNRKHTGQGSPAHRRAQQVNWALFMLEGVKRLISQAANNMRNAGDREPDQQERMALHTIVVELQFAGKEVAATVASIRAYNQQKTGMPPRSVVEAAKALRTEWPIWKQ